MSPLFGKYEGIHTDKKHTWKRKGVTHLKFKSTKRGDTHKKKLYVLSHSLDAHSFDSLSSGWDRPIRSIGFRVNGTSIQCMCWPISMTTNLLHGKGPKSQNDMIQFMIIKSLAICNFDRVRGSQMLMENRWRDFKILESDEDNLVGRSKPNRLSSKRASVPFTQLFV